MNNLIKKGIVVAVIFLFIGLAFAPSINANISKASEDSELVKITTEVCGLRGGKRTVKLTKEEAEEVEALFDSIRERLNATETRGEAKEIFNEAVVELDKYGLLGGLSVEEVLRLVTSGFQKNRHMKPLKSLLIKKEGNESWDNYNCYITGEVRKWESGVNDYVLFNVFLNWIGYATFLDWLSNNPFLWYLLLPINFPILLLANILPYRLALFRRFISPLRFGAITFGYKIRQLLRPDQIYYKPAEGWIWTKGTNGIKTWNGSFFGNIDVYETYYGINSQWLCIGADYFSGIYIKKDSKASFLGYAKQVSLIDEYPFD